MRISKAFHSFSLKDAPVINIKNATLNWKGIATLDAPSGAGKTTLFRLLSGWFTHNNNSFCVFDPDIKLTKGVRFIGAHMSLLPWKNIANNIHFQINNKNLIINKLLDEVGLKPEVAFYYPYQLSLGMYKRIELIISIYQKPKLLLLDEFFSTIDSESKLKVVELLNKKRPNEKTWVVAHEEELRSWISKTNIVFLFNENGKSIVGLKYT